MNTWNCDEPTARRCVGEAIEHFIDLIKADADTALDETTKLSVNAADIAAAYGLAILFRHYGVTSGEAVGGKVGELEVLQDSFLYSEDGDGGKP